MERIKVLITGGVGSDLSEECLDQIASISPGVEVLNPGKSASGERFDAMLAEAEIIYGFKVPKDVIARAPKLKWIQGVTAGVDWYLNNVEGLRESSIVMTNTSGIHGTPIGEFALGLMLQCAKQAPFCFSMKQEKQWKRFDPLLLRSATVGILGLGAIGREIARLSKAFRMRVLAIRRSSPSPVRNVDEVFPREHLTDMLAQCDYVVLALPYTLETQNLIGERELAAMKPTAYFINVARGGIVNETALVHALEEHRIAGAGLDVFATEPLPPASRLWKLPNVVFSPHVSGNMKDYDLRTTDLFCENLRRYLGGKRLRNVVDKRAGY